jgi:hypothetical protein
LEKRVSGDHDSPHRWWPTNAPIISGAIGAKQYFCFDRLNTTRERNSPTLLYIEYASEIESFVARGIFIFGGGGGGLRGVTKLCCQRQISHKRRKKECLGKFKCSLNRLKK